MTSFGAGTFRGCDIPIVISLIEEPFAFSGENTNNSVFTTNTYNNATVYVPKGTIEKYKATEGWKDFANIVEGTGCVTPPTSVTCEKPTISYQIGKLTFTCATEGATCHYSITDNDIQAGSGNEVQLDVTYNISVYATKEGYENSETATATLCWIDAAPQTEGVETDIANIKANAVLLQFNDGTLNVQGVEDGTQVTVFNIDGKFSGSAVSREGSASVSTSLTSGTPAIVRIGNKNIKVIVK